MKFNKLTLFPESQPPSMGFRDIHIHDINTNLQDILPVLPVVEPGESEGGAMPPMGIKAGANVKRLSKFKL